jgi:hypothetical protein
MQPGGGSDAFVAQMKTPPLGYSGDLNGDGHPDVIWQNDSTRQVAVWYLGGALGNQFQSFDWISSGPVPGWKVVAITDLSGDGHPDVIWQNDSTRQVAVWYLGGAQGNQFQSFDWISSGPVPGWKVVAVSDMNHDGHPDIVWQEDTTGKIAIWYMGGAQGTAFQGLGWISSAGVPGWTVAGIADLNGDGTPDIILQEYTTRRALVWYMGGPQGITVGSSLWIDPSGMPGWSVVGLLDIDGDDYADVIWQEDATRRIQVWYMSGRQGNLVRTTGWIAPTPPTPAPSWSIVVPH